MAGDPFVVHVARLRRSPGQAVHEVRRGEVAQAGPIDEAGIDPGRSVVPAGAEIEVDVTLDVDAARESFREHSPALVVVDLLISGGTGLGLVRFFKERDEVPVIAISVLASRDQALEAGADAFLAKPPDPLHLVSTIRDLLGSSAFLAGPGTVR